MEDLIRQAVFTVLGGAIAAGAGFVLAVYNRNRRGKDEFLSFLAKMESDRPAIKSQAGIYYKSTLNEFRKEVFRLKSFVWFRKRARIERLWEEYQSITDEQLDPSRENAFLNKWLNKMGHRRERPSDLIHYYLLTFRELVG